MALETKQLQDVDESDLFELIRLARPEGKTFDYKRDDYGNSDGDKKEFLADICAFANAAGGYLIIGIEEQNGLPITIPGIDLLDPDAQLLRLEEMIRSGITPRIPGVSIRVVSLSATDNYAVVIHIPKSWLSPHMVSFKGSSRFYSRNSAGKYQLDVTEIGDAFGLSETATKRIENFRVDRLDKIISDETPAQMQKGGKASLHIVPLSAFSMKSRFDLESLLQGNAAEFYERLHPFRPTSLRRNFDGLLASWSSVGALAKSYLQLFDNGSIEYVFTISNAGIQEIPSIAFEEELLTILPKLLSIQSVIKVEAPVFVMLSLLSVRNFSIAARQEHLIREQANRIDRDVLIVPELFLDRLDCEADPTLRSLIDAVWRAAGWPGSTNFGADGKWSRGLA